MEKLGNSLAKLLLSIRMEKQCWKTICLLSIVKGNELIFHDRKSDLISKREIAAADRSAFDIRLGIKTKTVNAAGAFGRNGNCRQTARSRFTSKDNHDRHEDATLTFCVATFTYP